MNDRFSLIDVNKNLKLAKTKNREKKLKITNELKLICAPNDVYDLWKEVITAAAHGELINPDTDKKFNARTDWNPDNCMLTREYFKFLGNLSYEELKKLANHILCRTRGNGKFSYPKVTIKAINSVLESCYTTKEWVERRKRKHLVKRELHAIKPELGLMNAKNEIIIENWKAFKNKYSLSRATMDVLLDRPGERYFAEAKLVRARNKGCADLSEDALNFFKLFLEHKEKFVKPTSKGHFRPYDVTRNFHSQWPKDAWTEQTAKRLSLGVMDFRRLPGIDNKEKSTVDSPFFVEVIASMFKTKKPAQGDVKTWVFICGDEKEQAQVLKFIESSEVLKGYNLNFADYYAGKNDRLEDASAAKTPKRVLLLFLQHPSNERQVKIEEQFLCPETARYLKARAYSELEYRMHNTELRMEFYLWLVRKFANPRECVFSAFAGGKFTCAAMVRFPVIL